MQLEETQKRSSKLPIELFERIFLSDRFLRHLDVLCFGGAVLFWIQVMKSTEQSGGLWILLEPKNIGLVLASIPTAAIPIIFHTWKEYKDENKDVRLKEILKVSIFILLTTSISVFLILYK